MVIELIKTEAEYHLALKRLDVVFDAPIGSVESEEADNLMQLIEEYEEVHYPIELPDNAMIFDVTPQSSEIANVITLKNNLPVPATVALRRIRRVKRSNKYFFIRPKSSKRNNRRK